MNPRPEMPPLQTISHYEILDKLGEGGMGVVWKGRDTRLGRFVALKVLPQATMDDPERKRRFAQEARAASALNHPNIVTIYDIDRDEGVDFIAMEFVPGKTLDQLIPRTGLRLNEALKYAIQVAGALSAAHAAGIVHRDLKPGNVMVSEDGTVKVLDFGLAKLTETTVTGETERTQTIFDAPKTDEGKILGTVSYMSPEQAEGKKLDTRSDIFSFGALLYEMLTGRRAFEGDSKVSTLAAILDREPDFAGQAAAGIPRDVARIVQRCLRKDPERRAQGMADLKLALEEAREDSASGVAQASAVTSKTRAPHWIFALAVVLIIAATATWLLGNRALPPAPLQATPLTAHPGSERSSSFSPDGKQVAFAWDGEKQDNYDIYVKLIGPGAPLRLTTDRHRDTSPAWSPDGTSIAFVRWEDLVTRIMLIPALGGPERELVQMGYAPYAQPQTGISVSWSPDGRWLAVSAPAPGKQKVAVWLISVESGEKRLVIDSPGPGVHNGQAAISPDGRTLAFARSSATEAADIYLLSLDGNFAPKGEPRRITNDNRALSSLAWTADSRELVFSSNRGGALALWRISASGGDPRRLNIGENGELPAISRQGNRLIYSQAFSDLNIWRANIVDPREPPVPFIASTRREEGPQYSPDGGKIAFGSDRAGNNEIWVSDADGRNAVQLVTLGRSGSPRWSPDGQTIAFDSNVDGTWHIYTVNAHGGRPQRLTKNTWSESRPSWSRDGKWIYFASNRDAGGRIWKTFAAGGGEPVQVTKNAGTNPFESKDGKTIYFTRGASPNADLWKVPAEGGDEIRVASGASLSFAVARQGAYFSNPESMQYVDFASGQVRTLFPLSKPRGLGLSLSPDEHWLLYTQIDSSGSNLMLVENFR